MKGKRKEKIEGQKGHENSTNPEGGGANTHKGEQKEVPDEKCVT